MISLHGPASSCVDGIGWASRSVRMNTESSRQSEQGGEGHAMGLSENLGVITARILLFRVLT